jgi:MerR family transcriptional regulator/heat shock protein HspR
LRLYSDRDIERLRQVKYLVEERGLNLAGVQVALDMTQSMLELRGRLANLASGQDAARNGEIASAVKHLDHSLKMLGYVPLRERT